MMLGGTIAKGEGASVDCSFLHVANQVFFVQEVRVLEGWDPSSRDESILSRSTPGVHEAIDVKGHYRQDSKIFGMEFF